jgi:hypothetical protein
VGGAGLGDIEIYFNSVPFKYHSILARFFPFCLNIIVSGHDLESSAELNTY